MSRLACIRAAAGALALATGGCPGPESGSSGRVPAPATRPTTGPAKEEPVTLRQVEVTILGKVSDIKGLQWPDDPQGRWRSRSVDEPCDLTIRLPGGKVLKMRTRPVLIVTREEDTVVSVAAPPPGQAGPLAEKARQMEELVATWGAVPNERMQASLNEFKRVKPPMLGDPVPFAGIERLGTTFHDGTEITFELVVGPPGQWNLNAHISAQAEKWERIWRDASARKALATEPSGPRSTKP